MQMMEAQLEIRENESNVIIGDLKEKISVAEGKSMQLRGDLETAIVSKEEEIRQLRESVQDHEVAHQHGEGTSIKYFDISYSPLASLIQHCLVFAPV
jgi:hypothetical protein